MKPQYGVASKIPNWVETAFSYIKLLVLETLSRVGLMNSPAAEPSSTSSAMDTNHFLLLDGYSPMSVPVRDLARFVKRSVPVITYSSFLISGEMDGDTAACTVCMEEISGEEKIRELYNCRHVFHKECVDRWVDEGRLNCPLCRSNLFPDKLGLAQLRGCGGDQSSTTTSSSDQFYGHDSGGSY
ncbi:Brassinosteroid-responsive RING protein 1 [Linum perenne]